MLLLYMHLGEYFVTGPELGDCNSLWFGHKWRNYALSMSGGFLAKAE